MRILLISLCALLSHPLFAQYYYNDIIGTRELMDLGANYRKQKVKTVTATGFDSKGVRSSNYAEQYEFSENGLSLRMTRINEQEKTIVIHEFDKDGRLVTSIDSFSAVKNRTTYKYDQNGRILEIRNQVVDSTQAFNETEVHAWTYKENGMPLTMIRTMQKQSGVAPTDSLVISFVYDESGRPVEEISYKKGIQTNYLYYYYDEQGRLTDIVRYNKKLKKLIPDIMFEYDENDRVIQKITTTSDRVTGYFIWRYVFNEKGLKTKEALFNNNKQLTGKIEYSYTFKM